MFHQRRELNSVCRIRPDGICVKETACQAYVACLPPPVPFSVASKVTFAAALPR